jgi:drug/metabolite transporter (DMT)-like permease
LVVFFSSVLVRAVHPVIIDASKSVDEATGKQVFPYQTSSTVTFSTLLLSVSSIAVCLIVGGKQQFASIWRIKPLILFSLSGAVLSLGNYVEMASMGRLHSVAYQILIQSKIVFTALFLMFVKRVFQTRLQWTLLIILMFSMSSYMIISSNAEEDGGEVPIMGMVLAFLKVLISCLGAVITDKYIKVYDDEPTHVHIARFSVGAFIAALFPALNRMRSATDFASFFMHRNAGFFSGWSTVTYAVSVSFVVKNASTLYILALLDSMLKNIAESSAVLVIYAYDVLAPWADKSFDVPTFLSVLVIVAACAAYIDSKATIEKAAEYDKTKEARALREVTVVVE